MTLCESLKAGLFNKRVENLRNDLIRVEKLGKLIYIDMITCPYDILFNFICKTN